MTEALACPFCRQRFEGGTLCLHCDIALVPALGKRQNSVSVWPDDYVVRPLTDIRGARGVFLVVASLSLLTFGFSPWLQISAPYLETRTGWDMTHHGLEWLWGGALGWGVSVLLVVAQRSPFQLRKLRPLLFVLAAMTISEVGMLLALPPTPSPHVQFVYHFGWGFYLSLGLAVAGCLCSLQMGGRRHREVTPRAPGLSDYRAPDEQSIH